MIFAGEGDQKVVAAPRAARPGKAMGEDAAFEIAAKLALDIGGDRGGLPLAFAFKTEIGLESGLDDPIEDGFREGGGRQAHLLVVVRRPCRLPNMNVSHKACGIRINAVLHHHTGITTVQATKCSEALSHIEASKARHLCG